MDVSKASRATIYSQRMASGACLSVLVEDEDLAIMSPKSAFPTESVYCVEVVDCQLRGDVKSWLEKDVDINGS